MPPRTRARTTWFLVALLAAISWAGEGLHSLPGCGHFVRTGTGYFYFGVARPEFAFASGGEKSHVGRAANDMPPTLEADQCPICQLLSLTSSPSHAVTFTADWALVQELCVAGWPESRPIMRASFEARAPPMA